MTFIKLIRTKLFKLIFLLPLHEIEFVMREKRLKLYNQLIADNPSFERKGKTMPYTSANGYMFSQLNKDNEIGIRLSKESGRKFMEKHQTGEFRSYGAVMRDYVLVPEHLYSDMELLSKYLEESYQHVMSLKPNTSKKAGGKK
jgi:hypothetical protein